MSLESFFGKPQKIAKEDPKKKKVPVSQSSNKKSKK